MQDHIFVKPEAIVYPKRAVSGGGYPLTEAPHEEDEEASQRRSKGVRSLLGDVAALAERKTLRDNMAYFVVDFKIKADHPAAITFMERIQSKLLAFLDENKTKVLATSGINDLKGIAKAGSFPSSMERLIFDIRPIRIQEQIEQKVLEDEKWKSDPKNLDMFVVPNIEIERIENYLSQAKEFLKGEKVEIIDSTIDKYSKSGLLSTKMNFSATAKLLQQASFIYKICETPRINVVSTKVASNRKTAFASYKAFVNPMTLPEVCVIDTGVNPISPLRRLLSTKSQEPNMPDDIDHNNHGTPVAYLAAYGEKRSPRARIISHKIISDSIESNLFSALVRAITTYLHRTRVFTCSVTFKFDDDASSFETWKIDRLIQASNSCVLFSAGNIEEQELGRFLSRGLNYPAYLDQAPVMPPSNSTTAICVGACCLKSNSRTSIAPADAPSPFTRYRVRTDPMGRVVKPEIVEHGGNLNTNLHYDGVGVSTYSSNGSPIERIGTSFSAPIVAGHLAEVVQKYGQKIRNAETLKAIIFSSCSPTENHPRFVGFGKPNCKEMLGSSPQSAKIVFEGEMRLANPQLKKSVPASKISVYIPAGVERIELYIVHSDNYELPSSSGLHTYIEVVPEKPARDSPPPPDIGYLNSREHVKRLIWNYQKAVRGVWFFTFVPHHIGIPFGLRQNVLVRYGGVLKLTTSRPSHVSLVEQIRRNLKEVAYS